MSIMSYIVAGLCILLAIGSAVWYFTSETISGNDDKKSTDSDEFDKNSEDSGKDRED